ncbi:MAG TPA: class I SAM-dependent methyltransferase, partial [Polyangiaceae bacterium]|nr:class I SAM-dependent methyltransferase [Polyangiaceae bacterium]
PMSALPRTLEPEVMDSEQEAGDYDAMDHGEVNARFCDDLLVAYAPRRPRRVLDVGTGTALIAIALCQRSEAAGVEAIDLARHMLERATANVKRAGLEARIHLALGDAKATRLTGGAYDTVMSNSLVHHIPQPTPVFEEMWRLVCTGGLLFVRDLARPRDEPHLAALAGLHAPAPKGIDGAAGEVPDEAMQARQRGLFVDSLRAALTPQEVRAMIAPLGIPGGAVAMTSDRHWTLAYVRP